MLRGVQQCLTTAVLLSHLAVRRQSALIRRFECSSQLCLPPERHGFRSQVVQLGTELSIYAEQCLISYLVFRDRQGVVLSKQPIVSYL